MNDYPALLAHIGRAGWVGRTHEIAEAQELWRQVCSGEGRVLLVSGEPGVGKTRFVRKLSDAAEADGAYVLSGECYMEGSTPYAPFSQIIASYFQLPDQTKVELPEDLLSNLAALAPPLHLVTIQDSIPKPITNSHSDQPRIFESFYRFCSIWSTLRPLLIFIDDVQWADADTLYLLRGLARHSQSLPVLIVLTYRDAELDWPLAMKELLLDLNHERLATHIGLAPLGRTETGNLLSELFNASVEAEFLNEVFTQTEGNPFFIEEVFRALIETGQIDYRDGQWHYPMLLAIRIPQTVKAAFHSRLRQLPETAQDVLFISAGEGTTSRPPKPLKPSIRTITKPLHITTQRQAKRNALVDITGWPGTVPARQLQPMPPAFTRSH